MEQRVSAVDFPVYGLDRFDGTRWIDFFEGLPGESPRALWLGHRKQAAADGIRVGTLPRHRYAEAMCPGGNDPLAAVAFSGAFGLVNLTLPNGSASRPDGLISALVHHAEQQAACYERWPAVQWDVDGTSVQANIWYFAGAWSGFTPVHNDVHLVAIGIGIKPDDLSLTRVADSAAYGIDFAAPLDIEEVGRYKRSCSEAYLSPPRGDSLHPDQIALLSDEPSAL